MPCFNSIASHLCRLTNEEDNPNSENAMTRRRFGIDSLGSDVSYDLYGEPVGLCEGTTDVYNDLTVYGIVEKRVLHNDEDNDNGGSDEYMKQMLQIIMTQDTDVQKNDVLLYPASSGDAYRVHKKLHTKGGLMTVYATSEIRSTK